ncbi:uncharacterized protein LOC115790973 [Archocentrus centrarchus]|uniref:uncharacterized protein LOC115790973 n=1 Tax=Archocentrus centrarchus TaxID=63155 RepID=UPI0011E9D6CD|nr:uncharacterized protein LOC115790973 [Archocentrus centrarchus]
MKPKWRSLGEPFCPVECVCSRESLVLPSQGDFLGNRGAGEGAEAEEPAISKGGGVSGCCDLEEFNVKTLYDKLEDQNLHVASQLARHRKDIQEFYRNICQQTESLKNALENMDHKKMSLLKEILVHKTMKDEPSNSGVGERETQVEACISLLGAVVRSVEALLCRLTGDAWQNQDLSGPLYCHTGHHDTRECEAQAGYMQPSDTNMCYTQFSSVNVTKTLALQHEPDHVQSSAPSLSDHDLSKLVTISPLFKTLQEIQNSLQNLTINESKQHFNNEAADNSAKGNYDGHLIPTALDNLSPQHSAIFLFGCQVMQLLANCPTFPSVLLLLAKSIPIASSSSNESLLSHCSEDFYYDETNQILYLSEAKLQHVGHFISVILQSMAHIASGSKPQSFMQSLHEAISALSLQLFNVSFKWSTSESIFDALKRRNNTLVEEFLNIRVPTEARFTEHLLASRLQKYKYFPLEQLISELKQTSNQDIDKGLPPKGTPVQMSCIEEEIDRMNESFLLLSMQLQKRAQVSTWLKEKESSAGNHSARETPTDIPSLSRNGTILLELKRRHVLQRLNELQITLGQIRRCQQHDSKSKDGTRGCTQTDSGTAQQGESENYGGTDGSNPTDGQQQDNLSASHSHSHSQKAIESRGLDNYKLESHISDQRSNIVQTSNPDPLLDCQMPGIQDLNVPAKQELKSETTIENTTSQTDTDDMWVHTNLTVDK